MKNRTNGAAKAAKTTTTNNNASDARALAEAMAAQTDAECYIPVTFTIRMRPNELVLLSRRARHTGETVDQIIEKFVGDGHDGCGGIMDQLGDWENDLPKSAKLAAAA